VNSGLPNLPILNQPPASSRTQAEKYGAAFYLGITGLLVLLAVIGWFVWNAWTLREVWSRIYVLNDPRQSLPNRLAAARALIADPRVSPQQRLDLCLSRTPPAAARFELAMSLDDRVVERDAGAYTRMVAHSAGWPAWLRRALVRPLAYGAGRSRLPREDVASLAKTDDALTRLWALCALAIAFEDEDAHRALQLATMRREAEHEVAVRLEKAARAPVGSDFGRDQLDAASRLTAEAGGPEP
jgi:hypothetical protein